VTADRGADATPRRWLWRLGTLAFAAFLGLSLVRPAWQTMGAVIGSVGGERHSPCLPGTEVSIMDSPHISQAAEAAVTYNSTPPTSGPHSAFSITAGIYDSPVRDALTVHAMEHGHVIIHYASGTSPEDLTGLRRIAKHYSMDVLLTPNPRLREPIALTAWGRIDFLPALDRQRIERFIEALRGRYDHGWTRPNDCPVSAISILISHGPYLSG
jgi:hypothetical protein